MRILSIALFLLWGACSTNPDSSPSENFGGDINSAAGRAWLAQLQGVTLKSVNGSGSSWGEGGTTFIARANGNVEGLNEVGLDSEFAGALSPTMVFYWGPKILDQQDVVQEARTKLEGFFISNVTKNNTTQIFIYPAALKLNDAEINALRRQVGISDGVDFDNDTTLEQRSRYYRLVHKPSNFDFTKPVTGTGINPDVRPRAIIIKP